MIEITYYEGQREKRKIYNTIKTTAEKTIESAKADGFPNCKGLYPDCPENPDKACKQCRTCPVLDED